MNAVRAWLEEKRAKGVKQVRVTSMLAKLDEATPAAAPPTKRAKRRNGRVTVSPSDLVGTYEAAQLLGVDRTRPSKWRIKGTTFGPNKIKFPEPFTVLKGATSKGDTPVFLRAEVEALRPFVEERRRSHRDDD